MTQKGKDQGLFERGGKWGIRYHDEHGREHREMIGSKSLARTVYIKRKAAIAERRFNPEAQRRKAVTLAQVIADHLARRKDRAGYRNLAHYGDIWTARLGTRPVRQVTRRDVELYRAERAEQVSAQTLKHELGFLRAVYRAAIEDGHADTQPVVGLRAVRAHRVRYLSTDEERRLYGALEPRWHALVTVALQTGMRQGEQFGLRWRHVDLAARVVKLPRSKSGQPRTVTLNDEAVAALRALPSRLSTAKMDWVFVGRTKQRVNAGNFYRRTFMPAVKAAKLGDFHWHDLRHTFATRLVAGGVDLRTVADLLGHTSLQMVMRYAHLQPGAQARAVATLPPPASSLTVTSTGTAGQEEGKNERAR